MSPSRKSSRSIAVIGGGHWGPNHIRAFGAVPGAAVTWAVDSSADRRRYLSTRFAGVRVTSRYEDVLEDPLVDAVVVATPAASHAALALAAIRAGKHVLCEKPLARSSAECRDLVAAAATAGVVLMVGHVFLFNAGIRKLKQLIDMRALGRLRYASAVRANFGPVRDDVNAAWDLAAHEIAILNFLFGSVPITVSASGSAVATSGSEGVVFLTLTYPDEIMAGVMASWLHPQKVRQLSVVGDSGMATFDDLSSSPVSVFSSGGRQPVEPYYDSYREFSLLTHAVDASRPKIPSVEPLLEQARRFVDAMDTGDAGPAGGEHGFDVVRTLEAVTASMRRGGASEAVAGCLDPFAAA